LHDLLPQRPGRWRTLIKELIAEWGSEAGDASVPASEIAEFCYESLAEQRRDRRIGDGVLLTTLHGAKGLEFPHVLIADGGWDRDGPSEEERRLFYVGMTRAQQTLTLLQIQGGGNPHLDLLDGDWLVCNAPTLEPPPPGILGQRWTTLTPGDLDLGYAGRQSPKAPIHGHLAAIGEGDELGWRAQGAYLLLLDGADRVVGRLSRQASDVWLPRLPEVEAFCIEAMFRHGRRWTAPEYMDHCRVDLWDVPLPNIRWRSR
ncbi:MAG: 3'-5' exonuclease, partial [Anaerolineae bacterium]